MKSLIAFLAGFALAVFLLDLLSRFLTFTLQPDYVPVRRVVPFAPDMANVEAPCDNGWIYKPGAMVK